MIFCSIFNENKTSVFVERENLELYPDTDIKLFLPHITKRKLNVDEDKKRYHVCAVKD